MTEPAAGQTWAYRARGVDPLVQAVIVRIGVKTPRRLLIRFMDDEFEGRQEWVPPGRLKAQWDQVAHFTEREARWKAVLADDGVLDSPRSVDPGGARLRRGGADWNG